MLYVQFGPYVTVNANFAEQQHKHSARINKNIIEADEISSQWMIYVMFAQCYQYYVIRIRVFSRSIAILLFICLQQ